MSIRTKEELQKRLHDQLAWRKQELTRIMLHIDESSGEARATALRAGVALLYAHWEGFVKNAMDAFLEYISNRNLKLGELQPNLAALAIQGKFRKAEQSSRIEFRKEIVSSIRAGTESANLSAKMAPSTRANLTYDVFKEITTSLGLDISLYSTKEMLINESLVSARNNIAHGEFVLIDVQQFKAMKEDIVSLMDLFSDQVQNAAATKAYLLPLQT